jgi:superfamily II DNA helicase RecQ
MIIKTLKEHFDISSFKSEEQREGLVLVMEQNPLTTVIIPTGGGKSILFMLPAVSDESGSTVVVVPYKSLANDIVRRCLSYSIDCMIWTPGCDISAISKIVVTVTESAVNTIRNDVNNETTFLHYLGMLKSKRMLRRIIIDECHTVITDSKYRAAMSRLFHLRSFEVPILFLSATLPPLCIPIFEEVMACMDSGMTYIRGQSYRNNIQVNVKICANGKCMTEVIKHAKAIATNMEDNSKVVIFCSSKQQAERIATLLKCRFYHGSLDEEERENILRGWLNSDQVLLSATTAFGTGIDIEKIAHTVHYGKPFTTIDYIQEIGRAGRAIPRGKVCTSSLFIESRELANLKDSLSAFSGFKKADQKCLLEMIETKECRSRVLTSFLNGDSGRSCMQLEGSLCDLCLKSGSMVVASKISNESQRLVRIINFLDWLTKDCPICLLMKGEGKFESHYLSRCYSNAGLTFEEVKDFTYTIKWPANFGICWGCGLPEEICKEIGKPKAQRERCKYKWFLSILLLYMKNDERHRLKVLSLAGSNDFSFEYNRWVSGDFGYRLYEIRTTNAFAVLDSYVNY